MSLSFVPGGRSFAQEALRSTAIPHAATEDNVYDGFFIPKGWCRDVQISFTDGQPIFRRAGSGECMVLYLSVVLRLDLTSTIFRAILQDPTIYPDPGAFKPERFLNAGGSLRDDPGFTSIYGFGKRICPGRHFVESTLFIVAASLFSVFNVEKGQGMDEGPDSYPYTGGGITYVHRACLPVWNRL